MKRRISTLVVTLAMLALPVNPARASYYNAQGPLSSASSITLEVVNANSNPAGSATAVNVLYFGKNLDFDLFTFPQGAAPVIISKLPRNTIRVVFQVNPPDTGTALVRITQGTTFKIEQYCGYAVGGDHCEIVVDVF